MAQFDVYRDARGAVLVDCQGDALSHLSTRLAAPLVPLDRAPTLIERLNPVFEIAGEPYAMITQYAATVRCVDLGARIARLDPYRFEIIGAFDLLLTGV